jgi:ElaA protein
LLAGGLTWRACRFDELSLRELQGIYMGRQQVFVVEQACAYLDADGHDESAWHLAAWSAAQRVPLAYARLIAPGIKYAEPSIGRGHHDSRGAWHGAGPRAGAACSGAVERAVPGAGHSDLGAVAAGAVL